MSKTVQGYRLEVAKEYGVVVAIVYDRVEFWGDKGTRKDGWVYKTYEDMADETALSEKQIRLAYKKLVERGVIETTIMKVDGVPNLHFRKLSLVGMESDQRSESIETAQRSESYIYTGLTQDSSKKLVTKEKDLLEAYNNFFGTKKKILPPGATKTCQTFTLGEIEAAWSAMKADPWHKERWGKLPFAYMVRASVIDDFKDRKGSQLEATIAAQKARFAADAEARRRAKESQ